MKTISLLFILFVAPMLGFGQNKSLDDIFNKFDGKDGITSVKITKDMMDLASQMDSSDFKAKDLFAEIKGVRVLAFEKTASEADKTAFNTMINELPLTDYKVLMTVKENNNNVKMLTKEDQGRIVEFLLLVTGDKEPVLVSITGNIEPSKLGKLSDLGKLKGFQYFAHMNHKDK